MFKSKIKFNKKELEKMIQWLEEYISYRGGMGNRIDAFAIKDKLRNKLRTLKAHNK